MKRTRNLWRRTYFWILSADTGVIRITTRNFFSTRNRRVFCYSKKSDSIDRRLFTQIIRQSPEMTFFFIFIFFARSFSYIPDSVRNGFSDFDGENNNTPLSCATASSEKSIDINYIGTYIIHISHTYPYKSIRLRCEILIKQYFHIAFYNNQKHYPHICFME